MSAGQADLSRRLGAEAIGSAMLLATVVGSGIMAEKLAGGNVALALLANTLATGAVLVTLILSFGSLSTHFNPAVTIAEAARGSMRWGEVPAYVLAQVIGAVVGVALADLMFDLPAFSLSEHVRSGASQWLSESIATFGLLATIWGCSRRRPDAVPFAVGGYITAAYWFTASTSFANPAVTFARCLTNTFAGIRPVDVPGFVGAQLVGVAVALAVFGWLFPVAKAEQPAVELAS